MLSQHLLRRIAVEAGDVDPRTVARFLRGDRVMPVHRERIEAALARLGLAPRLVRIEPGQGPSLVSGRLVASGLDPAAVGRPIA